MQPSSPSTVLSLLVLALLLACTVVTDLRSRRIPNRLVASGIAAALVLHLISLAADLPPLAGGRWWAPPAGVLAGGATLLPLYLLRATGAGDVKLMAMVGAFVGPGAVLDVALCTLVAGGLLAIVWSLALGVGLQVWGNVRFLLADWVQRVHTGGGTRLAPLQTTAARLPYALAIAVGTPAALAWPLFAG